MTNVIESGAPEEAPAVEVNGDGEEVILKDPKRKRIVIVGLGMVGIAFM